MIALLSFAFIILFAIFSDTCIPAVAFTVKQFLTVVLPSLMPFYVISEILLKTGFTEKLGKRCDFLMKPLFGISGEGAFAVIIGMISGYPAGAKTIADLYKENKITLYDATILTSFTNNTGPLFLIGAVGAGMLGSAQKGIMLYVIHIISALIIGSVIGNLKKKEYVPGHNKYYKVKVPPLKRVQALRILSDSMTSSIYTMLPIAGAIIFFSAIIAVMNSTGIFPYLISTGDSIGLKEPLKGLLPGFFEITTGIYKISSTNLPDKILLPLISLITGFAGISVHTQVIGILSNARINCRLYLIGKVLQSILSAIITYIVACFIHL